MLIPYMTKFFRYHHNDCEEGWSAHMYHVKSATVITRAMFN